jgi:1-acyl-sn-glycerol-3-phosphate acyltransferase
MVHFLFIYIFTGFIIPSLILPFTLFYKYNNWWSLLVGFYIKYIYGIKHKIVSRHKLIEKGFVLANHRSFADFAIDPYYTKSTGLGRVMAFMAVFPNSILGYLDNRIIYFRRGKYTGEMLFKMCLDHMKTDGLFTKRILFYPEGTRKKYLFLKDEQELISHLKHGLLKRVYNLKKYPVQLFISSNKEIVMNEKNLSANYGVEVNSSFSIPIFPEKFKTYQEFVDEIAKKWLICYRETHGIQYVDIREI